MADITIKINGRTVTAPAGSTILTAARLAGIEIPTLCFLKEINEIGACRICVVEVKGARTLVASCVYPINEGMEVWTNTPQVLASRKRHYSCSSPITKENVYPACAAPTVSCRPSAASWVWTTKVYMTEKKRRR